MSARFVAGALEVVEDGPRGLLGVTWVDDGFSSVMLTGLVGLARGESGSCVRCVDERCWGTTLSVEGGACAHKNDASLVRYRCSGVPCLTAVGIHEVRLC